MRRVLFCVSQFEYVENFMKVAEALPNDSLCFVGSEYWFGVILRSHGYRYESLPFFEKKSHKKLDSRIKLCGNSGDKKAAREKFEEGMFEEYLDSLLNNLKPNVVVLGFDDSEICTQMCKLARKREIEIITLHTSFVRNFYLVSNGTSAWEDEARIADLSSDDGSFPTTCTLRSGSGVYDLQCKTPLLLKSMAVTERLLRSICRYGLAKAVLVILHKTKRKCFPRRWYPGFPVLMALSDISEGCVLVALHEPLNCASVSRDDLFWFAIESTPSHLAIVLRPHPNERPARSFPSCDDKRLNNRKIYVSNAGVGPDLQSLFSCSRALVTITSALGMEALLSGVNVFALGAAFYAREGLARQVSISEARIVFDFLNGKSFQRVDQCEANRLFRWVVNRMIAAPGVSRLGVVSLVKKVFLNSHGGGDR